MAPHIPLSERLPRRYEHSPQDIFALVKQNMCDVELSQPALLVLPGAEKARMESFWQSAVRHSGVLSQIDPERQTDLLELSRALDLYPQFSRASAYMRGLGGAEPRCRLPVYPLSFIARGGAEPAGLVCAILPAREPQAKPHPLRARFHR